MSKWIATIFVLSICGGAQATYLDFEVANGSSYKSQTLSAGGDIANIKDKTKNNKLGWTLSYTHTASETTGSSGGSIKDNTHDFSGGLSLDTPSLVSVGGSLNFSSSPEENLSSYGPQFYIGKTLKYGGESKAYTKVSTPDLTDDLADDSDEDAPARSSFRPSVGCELAVGQSNYRQTYSASVTRANGRTRTVSGESLIAQRSASLTLRWRPREWVSLKLVGTGYSYDKDVAQFAANLDASPTLASSSLGGLLSGFPSSSGKLSLTFYLGDDWDLLVSSSRSTAAIAQTQSSANKLQVGYHFLEDWKVSIGAEVSKTEATSSSSESTDTQSLAALSYDF